MAGNHPAAPLGVQGCTIVIGQFMGAKVLVVDDEPLFVEIPKSVRKEASTTSIDAN